MRLRSQPNFPPNEDYVDVREAAEIYGNIVYGNPVDVATIQKHLKAGNYPSACAISGRLVVIGRQDVISFACERKRQVDAAVEFWRLNGKGCEINSKNVAVRLARAPIPPVRKRSR